MIKRPTTAFISLDAVRENYIQLKKLLADNIDILAVVKADAYGHGAVGVSKTLEETGCRHFAVATLEEAIELRDAGIGTTIIILGGIYKGQEIDTIRYKLTPVIFNEAILASLNRTAIETGKTVNIHVKIDTGMGRLGIMPQDAGHFFYNLREFKGIRAQGILTHLAEMDEENKGFSEVQAGSFLSIIETLKKLGIEPTYRHIANSAAMVNIPETHFNLVRPGIMLYGVYPAKKLREKVLLKPVMELKTKIIQLKRLSKGSSVSYGRTFFTERDGIIAVVPIGYGDGYPRHLSNRGEMLIRGKRARVAGVVCMDLTILDVTDINDVQEEDEVIVIGKDGSDEITAYELAEKADTIPYEILCSIGKRVPRIYNP